MSDASDITVALISAGSVLLVAAITAPPAYLAARRSKHAAADARQAKNDSAEVKEQVKNSHTANFREEQDGRHGEVIGLLLEHGVLLEEHREQLRKLNSSQDAQDERLETIERTWPRSRFMPPARHRAPDHESNGEP